MFYLFAFYSKVNAHVENHFRTHVDMNCSGVGYTSDAIMIQNDANQYVHTGNKDIKILA